ncbi:hypothetical protein ACFLS4_03260 [Bacteroidota bacterium]
MKMQNNVIFVFIFMSIFGFILTVFIIHSNIIEKSNLHKVTIREALINGTDTIFLFHDKVTTYRIDIIPKLETVEVKAALEETNKKEKEGLTKKKLFYNHNPKFLVWVFLFSFLNAISLGLIIPVYLFIRQFVEKYNISKKVYNNQFKIALLIVILVGIIPFLSANYLTSTAELMKYLDVLLDKPLGAIYPLLLIPHILALTCFWGILCLNRIVNDINLEKKDDKISINRKLVQLSHINKRLNKFLIILGLVIGSGSVITSNALKNAFNATFIAQDNYKMDMFPDELMIVYSLVYILFIILVYSPVYLNIKGKYQSFIENLNPINIEKIDDWKVMQKTIDEHYGLKNTLFENLKIGFFILAPVLSNLFSNMVTF